MVRHNAAMRILIDCCLSQEWAEVLADAGHEAVHWKAIGAYDALDQEILEYAADEGLVLLTHDLDFGTILATQGRSSPSVIQIRSQSHLHEDIGTYVLPAIEQFEDDLKEGAVLTIDYERTCIRSLPLK